MATEAVGAPDERSPAHHELLYSGGEWTHVPAVIPDGEWPDVLEQEGYEQFFTAGSGLDNHMVLNVWRGRSAAPFVVEVVAGGTGACVLAATLPDLMDLLAKWMPVVNSVLLSNLYQDLNEDREGLAELLLAALRRRE